MYHSMVYDIKEIYILKLYQHLKLLGMKNKMGIFSCFLQGNYFTIIYEFKILILWEEYVLL